MTATDTMGMGWLFRRKSAAGKLLDRIYGAGFPSVRSQEDAKGEILRLYREGDDEVRQEILAAMRHFRREGKSKIGPDPIAEMLATLLRSESARPDFERVREIYLENSVDSGRRVLLEALYRHADRETLPRVLELLVHHPPEYPFDLVQALEQRIGPAGGGITGLFFPAVLPLLRNREWSGAVLRLAEELHRRSGYDERVATPLKAMVPELVAMLREGDWRAAEPLSRTDTEEAGSALRAGLGSGDPMMRFVCACFLLKDDEDAAFPVLVDLFRHLPLRGRVRSVVERHLRDSPERENPLPAPGEHETAENYAIHRIFSDGRHGGPPTRFETVAFRKIEGPRLPQFPDGAEAYVFRYRNEPCDDGSAFLIWRLDEDGGIWREFCDAEPVPGRRPPPPGPGSADIEWVEFFLSRVPPLVG